MTVAALVFAFGVGQLDLPTVAAPVVSALRLRENRLELWTVIGVIAAIYAALQGS